MVSNLIFIFEGKQKLKRISICLNLGFIKRATLIFTKVSYKNGFNEFPNFSVVNFVNIFERNGRHWGLLFSTPVKLKVWNVAVLHPSNRKFVVAIGAIQLTC